MISLNASSANHKKYLNVIFDVLIGFIPWIGQLMDTLFKANLRNLDLIENWLLSDDVNARKYRIVM